MTSNKWLKTAHLIVRTLVALMLIGIIGSVVLAQDPSGRPSSSKGSKKRKTTKQPETTPEEITIDLTILTQPPDCQIIINGDARGSSGREGRALFNKLAQGHYIIEVRKPGFVSASRNFEAGSEAPTIVFKLEPDIKDKVKQFNDLLSAGKLIGPQTPNAFDIADELAKNYGDRPEVSGMRTALFQKLMETPNDTINRTLKRGDPTRDDLSRAQMLVEKAEAVNSDDRRAQALDLFFQGVIALRDWQDSQQQSSATKQQQDAVLADAKDKLEKSVQLQDTIAAAQYNLGTVLLLSSDPSGAESAFGKAAQLEPGWAINRIGIGDAMSAEGKRKDAVDQYRQAVKLDPNSSAAHAGLGLSLALTGQSKDGLKELEKAISLDSAAALPHFDLGLALAESKKKKDRERAEEEIKKAIELNSKNLEFQNSAAQQVLSTLQHGKKK